MYHEMKQAERSEGRSARVYVVPAAILAGWLMMVGAVIASVGERLSLPSAIEMVLSTPSPAQPATSAQLARR